MKENIHVWDATAGNRTSWEMKDDPRILWTDIEEDLSFKPDLFMDSRHTTFKDKSLHHIFFDPPHGWGRKKNGAIFSTPNRETSNEKWPKYWRRSHPRYYGIDKYANKGELKGFIKDTLKEFYRVLSDDGVLMVKWSEAGFPLKELLEPLNEWTVLFNIPVKSVHEQAKQCYWILLMKNLHPIPNIMEQQKMDKLLTP